MHISLVKGFHVGLQANANYTTQAPAHVGSVTISFSE